MNRKWRNSERTWTNLKAGLLRRYGERLDVSAAEWRVNQRIMMPGETYADFAAGLRDTTGRNRVEERVLLAQFYRCLSLTVRQLVKQRDLETLEEAVDHATEIDDTNANVTKGMQNIGQPFATAPSPCMVSMNGTAGQMLVVPGVTGTGIMVDSTTAGTVQPGRSGGEASTMALFTNPQGIWNDYTGWAVPKDRTWNGKFCAEPAKKARKIKKIKADPVINRSAAARADKRAKVMRTVVAIDTSEEASEEVSDEDEENERPPPRKRTRRSGAVNHVSDSKQQTDAASRRRRGEWANSGSSGFREESKCYACGKPGHFADRCPDPEAKARNDAYLATRRTTTKEKENGDRA